MNERLSPKEDLREWLVDNWFSVEDNLESSVSTYLQHNEFDKSDIVDRDDLVQFISERLKTGLLNVIETYEEQDEKSSKWKKQNTRNIIKFRFGKKNGQKDRKGKKMKPNRGKEKKDQEKQRRLR